MKENVYTKCLSCTLPFSLNSSIENEDPEMALNVAQLSNIFIRLYSLVILFIALFLVISVTCFVTKEF